MYLRVDGVNMNQFTFGRILFVRTKPLTLTSCDDGRPSIHSHQASSTIEDHSRAFTEAAIVRTFPYSEKPTQTSGFNGKWGYFEIWWDMYIYIIVYIYIYYRINKDQCSALLGSDTLPNDMKTHVSYVYCMKKTHGYAQTHTHSPSWKKLGVKPTPSKSGELFTSG